MEPKPEEKPAEEPEEAEEEEEEEEDAYNSEGELIEKPKAEKKPKKEATPPPKEPTPPPKEATPPPKEPTPSPEDKVEKKKRNWAGDLEGGAEEVVPEVKTPPKSKYHLEFLTKLENRKAAEGTSCKLYCQISGMNPVYDWFFNDEPLEFSGDVVNKNSDASAGILFPKLKINQSGEYRVVVRNRECRIEASCVLTVLETIKPKEEGLPPHFPFGIKREL